MNLHQINSRMELKIPPAVVTLLAGGGMWAIERYLEWSGVLFEAPLWLGICFLASGMLFGLFGLIQFYKAYTSVDPHKPGKASSLVKDGIYRISRNPMYVGLLLILLAYGIYLGNLLSLAILPLFVMYLNRFQILPEEQVLKRKFGADYERYKSQVRRWI
ncbi:MAG: methyltransferase family protein [Balneolaceae bacterium]